MADWVYETGRDTRGQLIFLRFLRSRQLCRSIDAGFDPIDLGGGLHLQASLQELRGLVLEPAWAGVTQETAFQKLFCKLVDGAFKESLLQSEAGDASFLALIALRGVAHRSSA